jgi:hypothetical protein
VVAVVQVLNLALQLLDLVVEEQEVTEKVNLQ